jgi:membrane-bound serine protease (ClpP class)
MTLKRRASTWLWIACSAALSLAGVAAVAEPSPEGRPFYRITLDGDIINPASAEYIGQGIAKAEADGAAGLILQIDTPGGLLGSTRSIVKTIMNARVPVIAYVAPSGARAGSAGVFMVLASHVAAMAPSTNIGAAHPVQIGGEKPSPNLFDELAKKIAKRVEEPNKESAKKKESAEKAEPAESPAPMDQKILNDTIAWAEAIAKERNRNVEWARKAVAESVSSTETEALKLGVVDLVAPNAQDLLKKLDGRSVQIEGREIRIASADAAVIDIEKSLRLRLLSALAHPNIAYILLMLGFYGLLFEFTHPGAGFPGVAGAICLILAFFGLDVLPTNYAGVALIVFAIALFIAEVKVTSYGLLTAGGLAALIVGSLILFRSPHEFMRVSLPIVLAFALSTFAIAAFLTTIAARSQRRRAVTGIEGMVGERGEVRSWEGFRGKVFVRGELWDAEGPIEVPLDNDIEVVEVKGMTLVVKQIPSTKSQTPNKSQ